MIAGRVFSQSRTLRATNSETLQTLMIAPIPDAQAAPESAKEDPGIHERKWPKVFELANRILRRQIEKAEKEITISGTG